MSLKGITLEEFCEKIRSEIARLRAVGVKGQLRVDLSAVIGTETVPDIKRIEHVGRVRSREKNVRR